MARLSAALPGAICALNRLRRTMYYGSEAGLCSRIEHQYKAHHSVRHVILSIGVTTYSLVAEHLIATTSPAKSSSAAGIWRFAQYARGYPE
jgi:hypothetical protein